ncbi:Alpha-1,2-mannosidase [hydrothermal vent metagenome]|uniref:Alpha-1,2-mannosidase n=1 Tax=hydrothermal vent metagenome TaxID=652676 RepID=A0A3B1C7Q6_9ZZZZ
MQILKLLKTILLFLFISLMISSCSNPDSSIKDYTIYVDPFIGTGGHGHTYPGATLPFGMVQLSPDTRGPNWDGSSGYHYSDKTIMGFSHTHLSGTGSPEFCDVLFMPTVGNVQMVVGDEKNSSTGYRSEFSHNNEEASAGYYRVLLDDYNVTAELTATKRSGFHKYTFPKSENSNIIIDLKHREKIIEANIQILNDSVITGLTRSTGWAVDQRIYFYAKFSKPFKKYGIAIDDKLVDNITEAEGKNIKAYVSFNTTKDEEILVKVGISAVSVEGARMNLEAENSGWNFEAVRAKAKDVWNKHLSKIEVEGGTKKQLRIFYTSLYHSALAPNLFMDVDSSFRGVDKKIHKAKDFTNYTVYSLWDVFRTQMPLYTILSPSKMNDWIKTAIEMYRISGRLPRWEIQGHLSGNMIGNHSLPLILDAYNKGIRDYDVELAYEGMKKQMDDIKYYNNLGFIPADIEKTGGSVAMIMEYAYNDWCLAEMAKILGKNDDYLLYQQRAQFYKNVFDSTTGFMRPKNRDYSWVKPFDPAEPSGYYVEGNAFQYSAFVPQDVNGLINLMGGDKKFVEWLDTLFTHKSEFDKNVVDAGGLIGQYAHGNEPSHQIAYMYDYAGAAPKTQKYVREILNTLYDDTPDGLSGNEDCGQISAWYIMSAMGFYPVLPGEPVYAIGTPIFDKVTINLENGKKFVIRADNVSEKNFYIQSAKLNGKTYTKSWFAHQEILDGGEFEFEMGDKPNYNWGTSKADRPATKEFVASVSMPYYKIKENYFFDKATITLGSETKGAKVYYTTDGSEPTEKSKLYTKPFEIHKTTEIKFFAAKDGLLTTTVITAKIEKLKKIKITHFKNYDGLNLKPGLKYKYYEENVLYVDELDKFKPKKTGITPNFSIAERDNDGLFAFIYSGYIKIPRDGVYTFFLSTNDGGVLYMDGKRFIDKDGPGTATPLSRTVRLKAGTYKIGEKYFQMGGGFANTVNWKGPGIKKEIIPASVLFHK